MRTPALLLAGFAALATQASARSDTDYPHRDWGKVVTLDMSVTEATACIVREMNRNGSATVIPAEGGNDIDWKAGVMFGGTVGEPWQTFKVRSEAGSTTLRIFYRHPVRLGANDKVVAKMRKQCLKVVKVE